jgi:isoleucyl-tRNA synthetase
VRQTLIPLWNAYYFFTLYANAADAGAGYEAKQSRDSEHVLDRYVLGKLDELVTDLGARLDALDVAAACDAVRAFLEVLSNWYIRRSRDRFWDGDSEASHDAFDTLYTVLETTTRAAAPLLPLVAEEVWRGLTGGRSVHLEDWPEVGEASDDVAALTADVALAAPRNGIVEIAGPERAPLYEFVARYLQAVGDPREVVRDPEARYYGGRVEEHSLVPLGDARLGRIGLDAWLRRRSSARA